MWLLSILLKPHHPDNRHDRNASLRSSGGAYGSERAVCGTTSVNKVIHPATVNLSNPVNSKNKKKKNTTTVPNNDAAITIAATSPSAVSALSSPPTAAGSSRPNHISLEGLAALDAATTQVYPPSPPEMVAASSGNPSTNDAATTASLASGSKPLTIANVASIPASYSTISSSPISDSSSEEEGGEGSSEISFSSSSSSEAPSIQSQAELRFLENVFGPQYQRSLAGHGVKLSSVAAAGSTGSQQLQQVDEELPFPGAILESVEHATRTLYVAPQPSSQLTKDSLIELMDLAIDEFECTAIVICLRKRDEDLGDTLHELLYVGGAIVSPDSGLVGYNSKDYVLVGLDL